VVVVWQTTTGLVCGKNLQEAPPYASY